MHGNDGETSCIKRVMMIPNGESPLPLQHAQGKKAMLESAIVHPSVPKLYQKTIMNSFSLTNIPRGSYVFIGEEPKRRPCIHW